MAAAQGREAEHLRKEELYQAIVHKHKEMQVDVEKEKARLVEIVNGVEREMETLKRERNELQRLVDFGGFAQRAKEEGEEAEEEGDEYATRKIREQQVRRKALQMLAEDYENKLKDKEREIAALRRNLERAEEEKAAGDTRKAVVGAGVQTQETGESIREEQRRIEARAHRWKEAAKRALAKVGDLVAQIEDLEGQMEKVLEIEAQTGRKERAARGKWAEDAFAELERKIRNADAVPAADQMETCGLASLSAIARMAAEATQENAKMSQTIAKYSQQIRDVSARNELINSELDKIMRQIPQNRESQRKETAELRAELLQRGEQQASVERALKDLREKVVPSLRQMLRSEQARASEMDARLAQYADLERQFQSEQASLIREKETYAKAIAENQKQLEALRRPSAESQRNRCAVRHCFSFWRPRVRRPPAVDIEDIAPHVFGGRAKTPASFERVKQSRERVLKTTDAKCGSDLGDSLADINTVSTNKGKRRAMPISMFSAKEAPVVEDKGSLEALRKELEEALQSLAASRKRAVRLEAERKEFKRCTRCLIANRHLLEEEKQKLILSSGTKRRRQRLNRRPPSQGISVEMAKVLFAENLGFKGRPLEFLKKQRLHTPLASTKGLHSLARLTGEKWERRLLTQGAETSLVSRHLPSRNILPGPGNGYEEFMITPRIERGEHLAKQSEMQRYFSGKRREKMMSPSGSSGAYVLPSSGFRARRAEPEKESSLCAGLGDTGNFKSFTTFLSFPKSLQEREADEAHPTSQVSNALVSANTPKVPKKRRKKKASVSKGKKKGAKEHNLAGLVKEQRLTNKETKMLTKVLKTIRSESKPKKRRAKRSLEAGAKRAGRKGSGRKKSCLQQLMKKADMRKLLSRNLAVRRGN